MTIRNSIIVGIIAFTLSVSPTIALAESGATLAELQSQISILLEKIKVLEAEIHLKTKVPSSGDSTLIPLPVPMPPVNTRPPAVPPGTVDPKIPTYPCVVIEDNLYYQRTDQVVGGQKAGGNVSRVQEFLQSRELLNHEPTGFFGVKTESAVKKFQESVGITPTGFVGSLTRAKIKEISCGGETVTGTKKPLPPQSLITVLSPNGGETLVRGTKEIIKWQTAVRSSLNVDIATRPNTVTINLVPYASTPPCPPGAVCALGRPNVTYPIAKDLSQSADHYEWIVGNVIENYTYPVEYIRPGDGMYKITICETSTNSCDTSDTSFTITGPKIQ